MKITWKHGGRSIEFERQPIPPERFNAVCGGGVLLVAIHMVGVPAIVAAVVALLLVGLYKLAKESLD